MLLALVLLAAAVQVRPSAGVPVNCEECCCGNNQQQQQQQQRVQESSARLETFEDAVTGQAPQPLPQPQPGPSTDDGTKDWQDEKHFISQDGKSELSYRAGQKNLGNGFTKFVHHSYRYSSSADGSSSLAGNNEVGSARVLSNEDFGRELERIRASIESSMGQHRGTLNLEQLQGQLQDICDNTGFLSPVHQEALQMMRRIESSTSQQFQQFQQQQQQRSRRDAHLDDAIEQQVDKMEKSFDRIKAQSCENLKDKQRSVGKKKFNAELEDKFGNLELGLDKLKSLSGQNSVKLQKKIDRVKADFSETTSRIRKCLQ